MQVTAAEATELFVGDPAAPLQVVRVGYTGAAGSVVVRLAGDGLSTVDPVTVASGDGTVEVPVRVEAALWDQYVPPQGQFGLANAARQLELAVLPAGHAEYPGMDAVVAAAVRDGRAHLERALRAASA